VALQPAVGAAARVLQVPALVLHAQVAEDGARLQVDVRLPAEVALGRVSVRQDDGVEAAVPDELLGVEGAPVGGGVKAVQEGVVVRRAALAASSSLKQ